METFHSFNPVDENNFTLCECLCEQHLLFALSENLFMKKCQCHFCLISGKFCIANVNDALLKCVRTLVASPQNPYFDLPPNGVNSVNLAKMSCLYFWI